MSTEFGSDKNLARVHVHLSEPNLPPRLCKALSDLKGNRAHVISKADKGNAVVLMDASHYVDLTWKHLSDQDTYSLLTEDPTSDIVSRLNAYLRRCKEDSAIDAWTHNQLKLPLDRAVQTI